MLNQKQKNLDIEKGEEIFSQSQGKIPARIIIIGAIAIFIVSISSVLFSNYYLSKKIAEIESRLKLPQEAELPQKGPKISIPKILYNLAGVIQKLEKSSLVLEATIPQLDETGQLTQKTEIRRVIVGSATKLSRLAFVTEEGTDRRISKETPIILRDLKIGDYIEVISNQDISGKQEFEATKIRILPKGF